MNKSLFMLILISGSIVRADTYLSVTAKYGPYSETNVFNQTTNINNKKKPDLSMTTSTPTYYQNRSLVPGVKLQYIDTFSIGIGAYTDTTVEVEMGIKL